VLSETQQVGWLRRDDCGAARFGDTQSSLTSFHEALALLDDAGAHAFKGTALLGIGEALLELRRLDEAHIALQHALTVQRQMRQAQAIPATLSALAGATLAQGRMTDTMALVEEVLAVVNAPDYEHTGELPPILWACYQVLRAANDVRAVGVLQIAQRLVQTQAASIDDGLRRSFLTQVKSTARLWVACAHDWLLTPTHRLPPQHHLAFVHSLPDVNIRLLHEQAEGRMGPDPSYLTLRLGS